MNNQPNRGKPLQERVLNEKRCQAIDEVIKEIQNVIKKSPIARKKNAKKTISATAVGSFSTKMQARRKSYKKHNHGTI